MFELSPRRSEKRWPPRPRLRGFTLVDVLGAIVLISVGLTFVFMANSRASSMLKSAKQAAVASKCLQQRIEQLRTYNWTQITDAQSLQDLYSVPPLPSVELPGFSEQITVSAFTPATASGSPAPSPSPPFLQIARSVSGAATLISDNATLSDGPVVRCDVQITWPGPGGAKRLRETSVIIANGGVGR